MNQHSGSWEQQPFAILDLDPNVPNPGMEAISKRRRELLRILMALDLTDTQVPITMKRFNIAYDALLNHYDRAVGEARLGPPRI